MKSEESEILCKKAGRALQAQIVHPQKISVLDIERLVYEMQVHNPLSQSKTLHMAHKG